MGEHRLTHREIRRRFQVKQARQHAAIAAGVEDEIGFDLIAAAVFALDLQPRFGPLNVSGDHGVAVADLNPLQRGLVGQQFVEIGALYLKGGGFAVAERVAKVERADVIAPGEGRAVFQLETRGLYGVQHAGFFDEIDAMRQQAFADGETREVLALDDQHIVTVAFEQGRRDRAGRPGTNHHHLTTFHFYY